MAIISINELSKQLVEKMQETKTMTPDETNALLTLAKKMRRTNMLSLDETIALLSIRMFDRYMGGSDNYRRIDESWITATIYGVDESDIVQRVNAGFDAMLKGK